MLVGGAAAGKTTVVVPLYEGRVPLPEEQTVLYLRALLGLEGPLRPTATGTCTLVNEEAVATNYHRVQEVLKEGGTHGARAVVPLHFLYLEIEVCLLFMVGALNHHVQEYSQGTMSGLNGTEGLEVLMRYTSWASKDLLRHWRTLSSALGMLWNIERGSDGRTSVAELYNRTQLSDQQKDNSSWLSQES